MHFTRKQNILLAIIPRLASALIRLLGCTLRFEDVCAPCTVPGDTLPGPGVFGFWHRSLLMAAYRFRNQGFVIVISQSFDGELIARTVERLGFLVVRGSSSRRGAQALIAMERLVRQGCVAAFTADGPRGPVYIAKPGLTRLAQRTTQDAGAFHLAPQRAWQLKSWDKFLIPKPFSRITVSWPQHVKVTADEDLDTAHSRVQHMMETAIRMAEDEDAR
ncbi:MAG: lysophospholipid acyltransferase family protein [Acidobacteria bacterium]|nr:lysophospholipid acyltransferase family protein [Acidobacteriota bacterium]